ncbi:MAG: hypothetical protein GY796_20250 [Chloroflexi bacterium]|nr:hypothetical protein [Chloroflexota bacterium]
MITRNDGTNTWALDWTAENLLKSASSASGDYVNLVYDADGQMVLRQTGAEITVYLGKLYRHELTADRVTKHYLFNGRPNFQQIYLCFQQSSSIHRS